MPLTVFFSDGKNTVFSGRKMGKVRERRLAMSDDGMRGCGLEIAGSG